LARWVVLALGAAVLLAAVGGCGDGEVESGATVSVYVDSGLCAEARTALAESGGEAGDLRVRAVCTSPVRDGARLDLATVGANARRATEDSTAVAYLESEDQQAAKFSQPVLETADLGWTEASSGRAGMRRVLSAIEEAGGGSVRDQVRESLEAVES
jgi:hypothetical protein